MIRIPDCMTGMVLSTERCFTKLIKFQIGDESKAFQELGRPVLL
jgi:hypothetical protein